MGGIGKKDLSVIVGSLPESLPVNYQRVSIINTAGSPRFDYDEIIASTTFSLGSTIPAGKKIVTGVVYTVATLSSALPDTKRVTI